MQLCRVRRNATIKPLEFGSKSNPSKDPYVVYLFRQDKEHKVEAPLCTCMPFMTGRKKLAKAEGIDNLDEVFFDCSHIKKAKADTCDWTEFDAEFPGYVYDGKCPKCGGPTVDDDSLGLTGVTKTILPADEQQRTNMEEVRKLAAELKGVEYVPLPAPVIHVPVISAETTGGPGEVQRVEVMADDTLLLSVVWDDDPEGPRIHMGDSGLNHIVLNDHLGTLIKEIQWPTT